jgi:hypothetical protein
MGFTGNEGESVLSKVTCDSSTSSAGFGIDSTVIRRHNQQSQNHNILLTRSLIPKKQRSLGPCPKSLSFHPNPCPCIFIVVFVTYSPHQKYSLFIIDSGEYSLLLLKYQK